MRSLLKLLRTVSRRPLARPSRIGLVGFALAVSFAGIQGSAAAQAGSVGQAADVERAFAAARSSRRPVQIPSVSSPSRLVWANPDGSQTVKLVNSPGWRRQGGQWVAVDAALTGSGAAGDPIRAAGLPRPVVVGGGAREVATFELDGGPVTLSSPDLQLGGNPQVNGSTVTFKDVARDTDLQVVVSVQGVKTNLVLRSAAAPTSFRFHLADPKHQLGGLWQQGEGGWSVFANQVADGERLALAPAAAYAPGLLSAEEQPGIDPSSARQAIREAGDGIDIAESVDDAWLAGKPFPVVLDPSVTFTVRSNGTGLSPDCHIVSGTQANTSFCASTAREVGHWSDGWIRRSIFKFDLTSIPSTATVRSATLGLYQLQISYTGATTIEAHREMSGWDPARATWNSNGAVPWNGGNPGATAFATTTVSGSVFNTVKTWDVTSLTQLWVQGSYPNVGMVMMAANETVNTLARFASGRVTTQAQLPSMTVSYFTSSGGLSVEQFSASSVLQSAGALEYAYVDNIGRLLHGHQADPDNFAGVTWETLSGNEGFTGRPPEAANADGRVQIVGHNINANVWADTQTAAGGTTWAGWSDLGGGMAYHPAVGTLPNGSLVVFAVTDIGELWERQQNGANGSYLAWTNLGAAGLAGTPTVVTISDGIQVFALDSSGVLKTAAFRNGALSAWTTLGSGFVGSPAVVVSPGYKLRVFARISAGTIVTQQSDASQVFPGTWDPVGSFVAAGSPSGVLSPLTGRIEIVARGADGNVYSTGETAQGSGAWRDWVNVTVINGDVAATDPTAFIFSNATGQTWGFVFRNSDQQTRVYTVSQVPGGLAAANDVIDGPPAFLEQTIPQPSP